MKKGYSKYDEWCKVKGCEGKHATCGFCGKHYWRLKNWGDLYSWKEKFIMKNPVTDVGLIPLTRGKHTIVDAEDYDKLIKFNWALLRTQCGQEYAISTGNKVPMHRIIMKSKKNTQIDHKNHNGLDNRKINLRQCTPTQNQCNRRKNKTQNKKPCVSKYKGIHKQSQRNKCWVAQISIKGNRKTIGYYKNEVDAAIAYDKTATNFFGEFAYLNFPPKLLVK